MKRLRKFIEPNKVRYFVVSEYGGTHDRPHYHMLLFNLPLWYDLLDLLQKCWLNGNVHIDDPVTVQRIAYVTKYCLKQITEDGERPDEETEKCQERNFMLCSRRPAIGSGFVSDATKQYFRAVQRYDMRTPSGQRVGMPRYYRDRIFTPLQRSLIAKQCEISLSKAKGLSDSELHQLWREFNKKVKRINSKEL